MSLSVRRLPSVGVWHSGILVSSDLTEGGGDLTREKRPAGITNQRFSLQYGVSDHSIPVGVGCIGLRLGGQGPHSRVRNAAHRYFGFQVQTRHRPELEERSARARLPF